MQRIVTMLLAALLLSAHQTSAADSVKGIEKYTQKIDGRKDPSHIPDHFAVKVFIGLISQQRSIDEEEQLFAYFKQSAVNLTREEFDHLADAARQIQLDNSSQIRGSRTEITCKQFISQ